MNDQLKGTSKTVMTCYDLLDVAPIGGVIDFTDGKYNRDPKISYEQAQINQVEYLLDEARCVKGSKLLDLGCGYGKVLRRVGLREARGIGITISDYQVRRCLETGLDVRLMNYTSIPTEWNDNFDCVVANGSAEHFVQVRDALEGKADRIYANMFSIMHRIIKPRGRFVTTIMHDNSNINPEEIIRGSAAYPRGSPNFHFARVMLEDLGGWYPKKDQLAKCAEGKFELVKREDGTQDYNWTAESWLAAIKESLKTNLLVYPAIIGKILRHGKRAVSMLDTWAVAQSWEWHFRSNKEGETPITLYRDTWQRV